VFQRRIQRRLLRLSQMLYQAFGIECRGVIATNSGYKVFAKNYIRETLARGKDMIWCMIKPAPTYGGEKIDIHGNGEQTLD
ncbi:MAG: hypothetical protein IKH76_11240, partial [Clostridiales bacterium]|nr:hypothetical protein [Clostridiales bacterium]